MTQSTLCNSSMNIAFVLEMYLLSDISSTFPHTSQAGMDIAVLADKTIRSIQSKHVVTTERD